MTDGTGLIGDIGGTNARFALTGSSPATYTQEKILQCADFETVELAISAYLNGAGIEQVETVCLAAAGPVVDGAINMTNNHWHLAEEKIRQTFNVQRVRLLNDFESVAFSLPVVNNGHCSPVGPLSEPDISSGHFRLGVIGPGTGLGVAGMVGEPGFTAALVTEGGHIGFAPETETQAKIRARLLRRYERVSVERLASGQGIENIYWALSGMDIDQQAPSAADIFAHAISGADAVAATTIEVFFEVLGQVAGDLALMAGTFDGIYLAGGILGRYKDLLKESGFRAAFERKGRHSHIMERIPTLLIEHPQPGLLGAAVVAGSL